MPGCRSWAGGRAVSESGRRRAQKVHGIRRHGSEQAGRDGRPGLLAQLREHGTDDAARPERPRPPTVSAVEHQTSGSDQLVQFFEHVADDRFLAAYVLAATTGMRRGEVLGPRWSEVDLDAGQLAVPRTTWATSSTPTAGPRHRRHHPRPLLLRHAGNRPVEDSVGR